MFVLSETLYEYLTHTKNSILVAKCQLSLSGPASIGRWRMSPLPTFQSNFLGKILHPTQLMFSYCPYATPPNPHTPTHLNTLFHITKRNKAITLLKEMTSWNCQKFRSARSAAQSTLSLPQLYSLVFLATFLISLQFAALVAVRTAVAAVKVAVVIAQTAGIVAHFAAHRKVATKVQLLGRLYRAQMVGQAQAEEWLRTSFLCSDWPSSVEYELVPGSCHHEESASHDFPQVHRTELLKITNDAIYGQPPVSLPLGTTKLTTVYH